MYCASTSLIERDYQCNRKSVELLGTAGGLLGYIDSLFDIARFFFPDKNHPGKARIIYSLFSVTFISVYEEGKCGFHYFTRSKI